jgi:endonuclease/exonuclease/phosphatase family metal-dependent hydrolase
VPGLGVLTVVAVHLRAFPGPAGAAYKTREAEVAASVVRTAAASPYRVVMGDFNAWVAGEGEPDKLPRDIPGDHRAAIVGEVTAIIGRAGVTDAWAWAGVSGAAVPGTVRGLGRRSPVDHIMLSADLGRRLTRVWLVDTPMAQQASDHLPLVARLELPVGADASPSA